MNRDRALALAKKGFKVFLVRTNEKTPLVANFPDVATSGLGKVASMWTGPFGESRDENIGISTDNLLILDFDAKVGRDLMEEEFATYTKYFGLKHVVMTAGGGYHAYLRLPKGVRCAGKVKVEQLGKSIDTRSWHNYVVAPGSSINHMPYSWLVTDNGEFAEPSSVEDLAFAHPEIIAACGAPTERNERSIAVELDTPAAISLAKDYLVNHAPVARQGEGGDEQTYKVACRVRDFSVGQDTALDLLSDHWNQTKAHPPWALEELERKVENAYRYAKGLPHAPGSEYDPVDIGIPRSELDVTPDDWPKLTILEPFNPSAIPKRRWILEGTLARGFLTIDAAAPGAGKTQWLAQALLAIAFNHQTIAGKKVVESTNVWSWNQEDDLDELKRRVGAAMTHYNLRWEHPRKVIALDSGVKRRLIIAKWNRNTQSMAENAPAIGAIIRQIKENDIGAWMVDPLAELFDAPENDNDVMKAVAGILRRIAVETDCAVMVAAHTRKPPNTKSDGVAGNQDALRGASSQQGVARIIQTLAPMTVSEAKKCKVDDNERSSYLRLDIAKANISSAGRGALPVWFKWKGVPLGNGGIGEAGDIVGVLEVAELAESRVKEEKAAERQLSFAEATAEVLIAQGLKPGAGAKWPSIRKAVADACGVSIPTLTAWHTKQPSETRLAAGIGRSVEFIKMLGSAGSLAKLWLEEASSNTSSESLLDDKPIVLPQTGISNATSNVISNVISNVEAANVEI